jgi:SAM-dependent methyltransferase
MTDVSAEMKAYYAERAPYYDAVYLKPERREDIDFLATYLPRQLAGREVLEVACGTGYWTQHIGPVARRLVATDLTEEPLRFARMRPGAERVEFRQMDAYALPASLGAFDAAFAGLWFSHVPRERWSSFLMGLHAVLRPGARVILLDNNRAQLRDFPIAETDPQGNTYQLRTLRDGSVHRVLKNFPTEAQLLALLERLGCKASFRMLQNFWLLEYELPRDEPVAGQWAMPTSSGPASSG